MKKNKKPIFLDEEEKDLDESLKKVDALSLKKPTLKKQKRFRSLAKIYLRNEAKMNIRINQSDLEKIKLCAQNEGLKYQTFIKSILHKYINGQLVESRKK